MASDFLSYQVTLTPSIYHEFIEMLADLQLYDRQQRTLSAAVHNENVIGGQPENAQAISLHPPKIPEDACPVLYLRSSMGRVLLNATLHAGSLPCMKAPHGL